MLIRRRRLANLPQYSYQFKQFPPHLSEIFPKMFLLQPYASYFDQDRPQTRVDHAGKQRLLRLLPQIRERYQVQSSASKESHRSLTISLYLTCPLGLDESNSRKKTNTCSTLIRW